MYFYSKYVFCERNPTKMYIRSAPYLHQSCAVVQIMHKFFGAILGQISIKYNVNFCIKNLKIDAETAPLNGAILDELVSIISKKKL